MRPLVSQLAAGFIRDGESARRGEASFREIAPESRRRRTGSERYRRHPLGVGVARTENGYPSRIPERPLAERRARTIAPTKISLKSIVTFRPRESETSNRRLLPTDASLFFPSSRITERLGSSNLNRIYILYRTSTHARARARVDLVARAHATYC